MRPIMRSTKSIILLMILSFFGVLYFHNDSFAVSGVRVTCDQEGAEIFLNDQSFGQCPKNIPVPPGNYRVVLKKDIQDKDYSYWYYETELKLAEDTTVSLAAKLVRTYPEAYYYEKTKGSNSVADYEEYLKKHPSGSHAAEIKERLTAIEDELYAKAKDGKDAKAVHAYFEKFPNGRYASVLKAFQKNLPSGSFMDMISGIEMVFVKGGCFQMGDTFEKGGKDAKPVHEVCLRDFLIGKYEVTQEQWKEVMGINPSHFAGCGDNCPVESVGYLDTLDFIRKLNEKTEKEFRLPTEAEWEYAARSGGKDELWAGTNDEATVGDYVWHEGNSGRKVHPVGLKKPNGLGLYDMSGNVFEWVNDWYKEGYYAESPKDNPAGPALGEERVVRSGCYDIDVKLTSSASRLRLTPIYRSVCFGFRLAMTPPIPKPVIVPVPRIIFLEDIHFDYDKATITTVAKEILDRNIKTLKDNPGVKVQIEGHTCAHGSDDYNMALGERRAIAVKEYLSHQGIALDRLTTISYGEYRLEVPEIPTPTNKNSPEAKTNRRAHFEIIAD